MLDEIVIDDAVRALRPDFAVLLMAAEGLANGPSGGGFPAADAAGATRPADATTGSGNGTGVDATADERVIAEHVTAWREAYRAFGVNPRRARPSVDALLRRGEPPRVNPAVDAYNMVSVRYGLPIGGEDLDAYHGPARLVRATGDETFDTVRDGEAVVDHPEPGEVVWRDDTGVTCRRWNWRQCTRTRLTEHTKNAVFVLERLTPYPLAMLTDAGYALAAALAAFSPGVVIRTRVVEP